MWTSVALSQCWMFELRALALNCILSVFSTFFPFFYNFETRSHYIAQAGLEFTMLLPQSPRMLRSQVCDTMWAPQWHLKEMFSHLFAL